MKSLQFMGLLLAVLLSASASMAEDEAIVNIRKHDAQRRSLKSLYYRGSSLPPPMTKAEKQQTIALLKAGKPKREIDALKKQFGTQYDLITYATRDSDCDGVLDFRFHLEDGRFFEGDVDVDGDGILNVYDIAPFDPQVGGKDLDHDGVPDQHFSDANQNLIPDHLDWTILKRNHADMAKLTKLQHELFINNSIILVDRTATFNLESVQAIYDTITKVYRKTFYPEKKLPTLRVISAENFPLLFEEDPLETDAMYHAAAQTLMIYRHSLKAHPLVQLGLYVHEVGHTLQYALDYDTFNPREENKKNYYMSPNLLKAMKPYGWNAASRIVKWEDFEIISPMYDIGYPEYYLDGKSTEEWTQWINDIRYEVGSDFLLDERVAKLGIVGTYSLSNIWEWLSDNEIAYVYSTLEKRALASDDCRNSKTLELRQKIQSRVARFWPDFYYANIEKNKVQAYLRAELPMTLKDKSDLSYRYIEALFCQ